MSKKVFYILTLILSTMIIFESILIIKSCKSDNTAPTNEISSVMQKSDITINSGNIAIPAYLYNSDYYIAAEDLRNWGFNLIQPDDTHISLSHDADKPYGPIDNMPVELSDIPDNSTVSNSNVSVTLNGKNLVCYIANEYHIIPLTSLESSAALEWSDNHVEVKFGLRSSSASEGTAVNAALAQGSESGQSKREIAPRENNSTSSKGIIVLDPGHGKSSSLMSTEEKERSGYIYNSDREQWGEWRHWKSGTAGTSCEGSSCTKTHPSNGGCWYSLASGDRDKEPEINLRNAMAAKDNLEKMGYTVRMTRTSNDTNPSFTQRISYCYPNNDYNSEADADLCVVIHSNAGGGRGSAYITAENPYDQKGISSDYAAQCNKAGALINDRIVTQTDLSKYSDGSIGGEGYLIAFCKSPIPLAYLEIGFFDNSNDLSILTNDYNRIGLSIAEGIDDYMSQQ